MNAPPEHRYLVAQISRDGQMRIARCAKREHADNIAGAWKQRIYTIPGELRRWTDHDHSSFKRAADGIASSGRLLGAERTHPRR